MSDQSRNPYLDGSWQEARDNLSELLDLLIWPMDEAIDEIEHAAGLELLENDRL